MLKLIDGSEDSAFLHPLYEVSERDFMGAKAVFTVPTARTGKMFPGTSAGLGVGVESASGVRSSYVLSEEDTRDLYEKMGRFLAQDAAPVDPMLEEDDEDDTEDLSFWDERTYDMGDLMDRRLVIANFRDRVCFDTKGNCADLDADQVRDLVKLLSAWLDEQDTDD